MRASNFFLKSESVFRVLAHSVVEDFDLSPSTSMVLNWSWIKCLNAAGNSLNCFPFADFSTPFMNSSVETSPSYNKRCHNYHFHDIFFDASQWQEGPSSIILYYYSTRPFHVFSKDFKEPCSEELKKISYCNNTGQLAQRCLMTCKIF